MEKMCRYVVAVRMENERCSEQWINDHKWSRYLAHSFTTKQGTARLICKAGAHVIRTRS